MNSRIEKNWTAALGLGLTAAASIAGASCTASDNSTSNTSGHTPAPIPAMKLESEPRLARLFSKPIIIGASVSADWGTASPSRRASLRHTKPDAIRSHAQGGRQGRATVASLPATALHDRSVVLAMDLFFWDTTQSDPSESFQALDAILEQTSKAGIPIVLGDVPELLAGRQPSRSQINERIHARCAENAGCYLWKLDELHRQVLRDGHLMIEGKPFTMAQIVPDGLHLSAPAGEWLADRLEELVARRR